VLTLGNAAKPAVVDDTAYLLFARQIAAHPADPYGFELFWYRQPEPAMHVLAPPVVPYWLGAGVALFGEHLFLLKLWLFPFAWLFCGSVWALLRRFARGQEGVGTALFALSPAVLPLFNFMLDLPAVALGLAAVVAFVRGCDGGRWRSVAVAGVLAGLAAQTKYTMATVPTVFILYGLLHRQIRAAVLAGAFAVGVFVMWEDWLYWRYGESHFLWNLANQPATGDKPPLFNPLLAGLGGLAAGWALFAGRAVRRLGGRPPALPYRTTTARLASKLVSAVGRVDYARVRLTAAGAEPIAVSGASILSTTVVADGFVLVDRDREGFAPGEEVTVHLYDQ
jgi:hypothetical protein